MERPACKRSAGKNAQRLLESLDQIIVEHGPGNPALERDLKLLREELDTAVRQGRARDIASTALKAAAWVKFVYDLLHPD
jgi:hypothetical protein